MAEIALGNLYELNQQAMSKLEPLNKEEISKQKKIIEGMFFEGGNHYYMMLNKERSDYTVFEVPNITYAKEMTTECIDCLKNRGKILSIERETPEISAIEIWIRGMDKKNYMYMLFSCDAMIISPANRK